MNENRLMKTRNYFAILTFIGFALFFYACNSPETAEKNSGRLKIEKKTADKKKSNQKTKTKPTTKTYSTETKMEYAKYGIDESSIASIGEIAIGQKAPDFTGIDQNGNRVQLSGLLANGPVVLIFYRGYWCPLCTRYLGEYVDQLDQIKAKGAQVIAIAPEGEKFTKQTEEKTKLAIPFISDSDNSIMKKYGVAFKVNESYNKRFSDWKDGATIGEVNGQDEASLPIPATYIIGKDGAVKWSHFDPNYQKRPSVEDVMKNLGV